MKRSRSGAWSGCYEMDSSLLAHRGRTPTWLRNEIRHLAPVRDAIYSHRVLITLVSLQVLFIWVICTCASHSLWIGLGDAVAAIDGAIVLAGAATLAAALVRSRTGSQPLGASYFSAWRSIRASALTPVWIASVLLMSITLPISLAVFSAAKRTIPAVQPFAWDARLEQLGRAVHGGKHVWQWLQPLVGHPALTIALDRYYHIGWTLLVLGGVGLAVVSPVSARRSRFLTSWVALTFLCGTVAAMEMSSAGPVYFHRVVRSADPFTGLRDYLAMVNASTPLLSVEAQRSLWWAHQHQLDAFGSGISAMPSMHIASTALVACFAWSVSRALGVFAAGATGVMFVGSVSLGWHYGIDGYAGALFAVIIWIVVGRLESRVPGGRWGNHRAESCSIAASKSVQSQRAVAGQHQRNG